MAMSDKVSKSKRAPPWPPTTHQFLAIKIACRQLGVRAAVDELDLQNLIDDFKEAPPIPAPAAQDDRYLAFAEYIVDGHYWMDPLLDIWLVDYWWAWGLLNGNLAAPNAYVQPDVPSVVRRSKTGSNYSGFEMWM